MAVLSTILGAVVVFGFGIYVFSKVWAVREQSRIEQTAEMWYSRFSDGNRNRHTS